MVRERDLPLLPTALVGSYALPAWLWSARADIDRGAYGPRDIRETLADAVAMAVRDQERAGLDIITDGEMGRQHFVRSFHRRLTHVEPAVTPRRMGVTAYDAVPLWRTTGRVSAPGGLGLVEEWRLLRALTAKPTKICCPGPLTLSNNFLRGMGYASRWHLAHDLARLIRADLMAVVAAGATYLQIDEPSLALPYVGPPGEARDAAWLGPSGAENPAEMVRLIAECVRGVKARVALHVCFGNLVGRPMGKRTYRVHLPMLPSYPVQQFVFEFASREMAEIADVGAALDGKTLALGVVDVKSFYVETAHDVAERIRLALKHVSAEHLWIVPDCGFWETPRWIAYAKMCALVEGTRVVRQELGRPGRTRARARKG